MDKQSKDQIIECVGQLADRCRELGDENMHYVLLCVAMSFREESEDLLCVWMKEYAKMRIETLKEEIEELGKNDEKDS